MRDRIRNILILMSICILAILGFQGNWLYNSYQVKLDAFNKEINEAMRTAMFNTQLLEAQRLIGRRVKLDSVAQIMKVKSGPDGMVVIAETLDSAGRPRLARTVPTKDGRSSYRIVPADTAVRELADTVARKLTDILLTQRFYEEPVSLMRLDSMFNQELRQRGLRFYHKLDTIKIDVREGDSSHLALLQPTDKLRTMPLLYKLDGNFYVEAVFSHPVQYILSQMYLPLLSSGVLIILTVLCFLYMLRTILRQKRLSDVRSDFINNMTHELKTPIATVSAAVEAMQHFNALSDLNKTQSYLSISRNELQRLSDLVEKVLHIAAEEKEDMELHREPTDINDLVSTIINNYRIKANKPVDFTYTVLSDAIVKVDRTHLANAISNLVDNAIKYSGEKEKVEITIQVSKRLDWLRILIKDNGIGIPHSYLTNIFEKFFRVPTGNLHKVKGFGLGLNYVKQVVEKHGGTIRVTSDLEKGSEFLIDIPEIDKT